MERSLTGTLEQTFENVLRMHLPSLEGNDEEVPMDMPLADLGLDSLRAVNLVLDLEDTFAVEFPDSVLTETTFQTGAAVRDALRILLDGDR